MDDHRPTIIIIFNVCVYIRKQKHLATHSIYIANMQLLLLFAQVLCEEIRPSRLIEFEMRCGDEIRTTTTTTAKRAPFTSLVAVQPKRSDSDVFSHLRHSSVVVGTLSLVARSRWLPSSQPPPLVVRPTRHRSIQRDRQLGAATCKCH